MAIGAESGCVEGDQCRTGGLCAHHTLDGGVDAGDAGLFAGDEAAGRLGVGIGGVKGGLPCGPDGVICGGQPVGAVGGFVAEHKVRVVVQVGPLLCQQRVGGGCIRLPAVKKGEDGFGGRGVHAVEHLVVEGGTGFEALAGTLGLALFVCAQQIGRIVAQKVRGDAGGALDPVGDRELPGGDDGLFALGDFLPQVVEGEELAVGAEAQFIADFELTVPAGGLHLALLQELFIIGGECLEYHVNTSTSRHSITPSTSFARKNWLRMLAESE